VHNHIIFAVCLLAGFGVYFQPIGVLAALTLKSELYSHIGLIPLVAFFFIWIQRKVIFAVISRSILPGASVVLSGLGLYVLAMVFREQMDMLVLRNNGLPNDYLSLCMAGFVAWVIGSFIALYGVDAFKKAMFPLLFLAFIIPIPMFLITAVMKSLQYASAEAADIVFRLAGVPYHRNGLIFEFPNVAILVAEQCSGIRSSLALFILSIITGYLALRTFSRRVILALMIFPITVIKNGFRIVTITLLANYVDMSFLTSHWIHRSGGMPFFAAAIALFIPLVWVLRRSEGSGTGPTVQGAGEKEPAGESHLPAQICPRGKA
jgi:exosortase